MAPRHPVLALVALATCAAAADRPGFSGIHPHLAMHNNEGECGTGAVVPWAGRLWVITYAPHKPDGSSDKLFEITPDLVQTIRPESVGGTPANRLIHRESNQLVIGPYVIDAQGAVRVITPKAMPGRHTGSARHLTDPVNKVYTATMEEGVYEIDLKTLAVTTLFADSQSQKPGIGSGLPGYHGKGLYSGQGVLVYANNGERSAAALTDPRSISGVLAEWDGVAKDWTVVRRNQFTEITGPGGLYGNADPAKDPLWATGWDHKSVLLALRDVGSQTSAGEGTSTPAAAGGASAQRTHGEAEGVRDRAPAGGSAGGALSGGERPPMVNKASSGEAGTPAQPGGSPQANGRPGQSSWTFFRLPKASRSYDGAHGWNTEWPRIRDIGADGAVDRLMTMHGLFWRFPENFTLARHAGPRPRSAYLKVVGDFARWDGRIVLGCDDAANSEFLNKRAVKGHIPGPLKSNSNLWFVDPAELDRLGPTQAEGGIWQVEAVQAGQASDAMLFAGWRHRSAWFSHDADAAVTFTVETEAGDGAWKELTRVSVPARGSAMHAFAAADAGEWLRIIADRDVARATVHLTYANDEQRPAGTADPIFAGLGAIDATTPAIGGLVRSTWPVLQVIAGQAAYVLDADLNLVPAPEVKSPAETAAKLAVPTNVVTVDAASVLVVDGRKRRWRLPKGDAAFDVPTCDGSMRLAREVATERDLFNCHGTFYELPAENADGFAVIRPVASHRLRIADFCSHRGMMVLTGLDPAAAKDNPRVRLSADGRAAVWLGAIDDLWRLGRPTGQGGPWMDSAVTRDVPSDAYLLWGYGRRTLTLSHRAATAVTMRIELDLDGQGRWLPYASLEVAPGASATHVLPEAVQARWVRITAGQDCTATARFLYE